MGHTFKRSIHHIIGNKSFDKFDSSITQIILEINLDLSWFSLGWNLGWDVKCGEKPRLDGKFIGNYRVSVWDSLKLLFIYEALVYQLMFGILDIDFFLYSD